MALCAAFLVVVLRAINGLDESLGLHAVDEKTAPQRQSERGVVDPGTLEFLDGTELVQFSGKDTYRVRYSVDDTFENAEHQLAQANPGFPTFRRATCDDEIVATDFVDAQAFGCDTSTDLAVSTRSGASGDDVLTDAYQGTPPDSETLLLVDDGEHVDLFVLAQGH